MPDTREPKWGEMTPGGPRHMPMNEMSDKWHDMDPSDQKTSAKWEDMEPSKARTSQKWVDIETEGKLNPKWNDMVQTERDDPYSMAPSAVDRKQHFKESPKIKPETRVQRPTQHTEFGSTTDLTS